MAVSLKRATEPASRLKNSRHVQGLASSRSRALLVQDSQGLGFLGSRVLGFRVLGFRDIRFRVIRFRVLGFRV